jgi:hypothetical protein
LLLPLISFYTEICFFLKRNHQILLTTDHSITVLRNLIRGVNNPNGCKYQSVKTDGTHEYTFVTVRLYTFLCFFYACVVIEAISFDAMIGSFNIQSTKTKHQLRFGLIYAFHCQPHHPPCRHHQSNSFRRIENC